MNTSSTQICTCHQLLHPQVLQLLIKLFETEHSQLDVMEQVGVCVTLMLLISVFYRGRYFVIVGPLS